MKSIFKIIASLITLAFTIVLVGFVLVINLDPNEHKDWIAEKIEDNSGLTVSFNGNIGLTFYPWLGITLDDVVVANPPGFSASPLLEAEHAEFRARFMPLLNREYEIDTIQLQGTRIHLETNALGESNWQSTRTTTSEDSAANSTASINRLVIGGVNISDAALTFDDRFNDVRYDIANISASTDELIYGEPINIYLGFTGSASRPALSTEINLTGTVLYDLDNQRYDLAPLGVTGMLSGANVPGGSTELSLTTTASLDLAQDTLILRDFSLSALDTQVNANINGLAVSSANPQYQVNMAAAGTDLAVLFQVLENEALVGQINALASRSFRLNALVESSPAQGSLSISNLDANLLDANISGDLNALNLQSDTPSFSGALNASGPDLPTLMEVAGSFMGNNSELSRYGRELQQAPEQSFLLTTTFDANLQSGVIEVPELEARVLGTSINGSVSARDAQTDTPVFRGNLNASGPDLPMLMQFAGQMTGGRESALNQYGRQLRAVSNKNFSIAAPFDVNLATGNIDLSSINVNALGLRLTGSLQGNDFQSSTGSMAGTFNLTSRNLSEILTAFEQPDLAGVLQSMTLDIAVNGQRANLAISPLNLDLVFSGPRIPNSPVTVALKADSIINLDNESIATRNFSLAGLGLNLSGSANISDYSGTMNYSGQVSQPTFNLRRLMQQLNQDLPLTMDNSVLQSLALTTSFSGSNDNIQLQNLDMTLDDSRFTGAFTMAGAGTSSTTPAIDFDLDITAINLDRYLAPATDTPETNDMGNTELPIDSLRTLNLNGEINVGQLTYSNLNLQNLALEVNASDGQLALAPISANLYQGSYEGDIRLSVASDVPVASVDTNLQGINLAPLLRDFMDASYVSGVGNISLALTGRGTDTATIKRNLNGTGSLVLQDGVLEGVDVGSVLAQVETMIRERRPATVVRGERTPFDNFSATIDVSNGIVSSQNLLIESSGFDVTGSGTLVNLANDTIAFNLIARVDENPATDERAYDIGGYQLPIACTGVLASPRCLPDIQAIIAGAISNAVQRGLTDLLERAIGNEAQQQTTEDNADETQTQEQETDPGRELFNRALENLFNR